MSKPTPGPWRVVKQIDGTYMLIGADETIVCDAFEPNPQDARLIAAAPDLLEALKVARGYVEEHACGKPHEDLSIVDAAIAKAEGK